MKSFFKLVFALAASTAWAADWTVERVAPESIAGAPDGLFVKVVVKNTANRSFFMLGMSLAYHLVESFIKAKDGDSWEKRSVAVCGNCREIMEVKRGQSIEVLMRIEPEEAGRPLLLTFRRSLIPDLKVTEEVLVGPITLPVSRKG